MSSIKISSSGAYLTSWKIKDKEVLYQGSELKRTGIPLLFPNFDAGSPLPNHGFGRLSPWQIVDESENNCHLCLTDDDISPKFRQIYPYQFIADLKISTKDNILDYLLEVKNLSRQNLPVSPGLHPYWPVKHELKSQIKLINYSQFIPETTDWNNNPPNNLFDFPNEFIADFPNYQLTIKEIFEDQKYFKHLQIWSQNTNFPDYNYVCFEPVVNGPNGINTNPVLIKPNNSIKFHLQFIIDFKNNV